MSAPNPVGVGVIGAGEVFQICHGPALLMMPHLFRLESICDVSPTLASHCAAKFHIPHHAVDPTSLLADPKIDLVMVLTSDDMHEALAIAALKAGKRVFLEKPLTLSLPAARRILDAEREAISAAAGEGTSSSTASNRVFVGYMRRYAPSYLGAFRREVASIPRVLYARVRDFSGPNAGFTSQSGTFAIKPPAADFSDRPEMGSERDERLERLFGEAFPGEEGGKITDEHRKYVRFLGSLASHDISLMRETLGVPEKVEAVSVHEPFYSAVMGFRNPGGEEYSVTYESGIDKVPVFDAGLTVYGEEKRVSIKYQSPYVKGLPIVVEVDEVNEHGETQHREVLSSYEDTYTAELQEVHAWVTTPGKTIKTTTEDAMEDLKIYDMMYKAWAAQKARAA